MLTWLLSEQAQQAQNRHRTSTVLRTGRFGWQRGVLPVLIVEWANQDFPCRVWKIAIGLARGGECD